MVQNNKASQSGFRQTDVKFYCLRDSASKIVLQSTLRESKLIQEEESYFYGFVYWRMFLMLAKKIFLQNSRGMDDYHRIFILVSLFSETMSISYFLTFQLKDSSLK